MPGIRDIAQAFCGEWVTPKDAPIAKDKLKCRSLSSSIFARDVAGCTRSRNNTKIIFVFTISPHLQIRWQPTLWQFLLQITGTLGNQ